MGITTKLPNFFTQNISQVNMTIWFFFKGVTRFFSMDI